MLTLIITVISIGLIVIGSYMGLSYIGSTVTNSSDKANGVALIKQGEQLASATVLYTHENAGTKPSTPAGLVPYYLEAVPTPVKSAYIDGETPDPVHWEYYDDQNAHVIIYDKIEQSVCESINRNFSLDHIPAQINWNYPVQCFGDPSDPAFVAYNFIFDPPGGRNMIDLCRDIEAAGGIPCEGGALPEAAGASGGAEPTYSPVSYTEVSDIANTYISLMQPEEQAMVTFGLGTRVPRDMTMGIQRALEEGAWNIQNDGFGNWYVPSPVSCDSGSYTANWVDADASNSWSTGDTVTLTYSNCYFAASGSYIRNGEVQLTQTSVGHYDVNYNSFRYSAGTSLANSPIINGGFRLDYGTESYPSDPAMAGYFGIDTPPGYGGSVTWGAGSYQLGGAGDPMKGISPDFSLGAYPFTGEYTTTYIIYDPDGYMISGNDSVGDHYMYFSGANYLDGDWGIGVAEPNPAFVDYMTTPSEVSHIYTHAVDVLDNPAELTHAQIKVDEGADGDYESFFSAPVSSVWD